MNIIFDILKWTVIGMLGVRFLALEPIHLFLYAKSINEVTAVLILGFFWVSIVMLLYMEKEVKNNTANSIYKLISSIFMIVWIPYQILTFPAIMSNKLFIVLDGIFLIVSIPTLGLAFLLTTFWKQSKPSMTFTLQRSGDAKSTSDVNH